MSTKPDPRYPSITCPRCGMTSYHPVDIAEGYCGNCGDFTSRPTVNWEGTTHGGDPIKVIE